MKMKQRFFFDRINVLRNHLIIDKAVENAIDIFTNGADSAPAQRNNTAMAAQAALHGVFFYRLLKHCPFHKGSQILATYASPSCMIKKATIRMTNECCLTQFRMILFFDFEFVIQRLCLDPDLARRADDVR